MKAAPMKVALAESVIPRHKLPRPMQAKSGRSSTRSAAVSPMALTLASFAAVSIRARFAHCNGLGRRHTKRAVHGWRPKNGRLSARHADGQSSGSSAVRSGDDYLNKEIESIVSAAEAVAPVRSSAAEGNVEASKVEVDHIEKRKPPSDAVSAELSAIMQMLSDAEEFSAAALVRQRHSTSIVDDETEVLWKLQQFYDAMRGRNLKVMKDLWHKADAPYVRCLHPADRWQVGYTNVIRSWKSLFNDKDFCPSELVIEDRAVHLYGVTAIVTCIENAKDSQYHVTNIFRFNAERWALVQRHVSPPMTVWHNDKEEGEEHEVLPEYMDKVKIIAYDMDPSEMSEHDEDEDDDEIELVQDYSMPSEETTKRMVRKEALSALKQIADKKRQKHITREEYLELVRMMIENPTGESFPEKAYELLLHGTACQHVEDRDAKYLHAWHDFVDMAQTEAQKALRRALD